MKTDWKVGDEFRIIDPDIDHLGLESSSSIFVIARLIPKANDHGYNEYEHDKMVWFYYYPNQNYCNYASKSNIKPLTKLERVLK